MIYYDILALQSLCLFIHLYTFCTFLYITFFYCYLICLGCSSYFIVLLLSLCIMLLLHCNFILINKVYLSINLSIYLCFFFLSLHGSLPQHCHITKHNKSVPYAQYIKVQNQKVQNLANLMLLSSPNADQYISRIARNCSVGMLVRTRKYIFQQFLIEQMFAILILYTSTGSI